MDVWDTVSDEDPDMDGSSELEGQEDTEISELGEFEKLELGVSIELWDWLNDGVIVNDPRPEGVGVIVEHIVVLGDPDRDALEVEVFELDIDPVVVLDFNGLAEIRGDAVSDLDTIDVKEPLDVSVPVLLVEVDPDTEFVEDMLDVSLVEELLVTDTEFETDADAVEDCVEQDDIVSERLWEDDPVYDKVSIEEIDGIEDIDGAELTLACDADPETEEVYEFVTVFLTKLSVAVCEEVVECVEVIVFVLEPTDDLEIVGEADLVLVTEADAETVLVLYIVLVTIGLDDKLLRLVDVLDIELDLVFVGELVWDFDAIELKEFVCVWTWDLDTLELPE